MMCVACVGLWGGIAVSLTISMKTNRDRRKLAGKNETFLQEYEEAEMTPPDHDEE